MSCYTTDNKTCINHIYTNLLEEQLKTNILETYFSDHKAVYALFFMKLMQVNTNVFESLFINMVMP